MQNLGPHQRPLSMETGYRAQIRRYLWPKNPQRSAATLPVFLRKNALSLGPITRLFCVAIVAFGFACIGVFADSGLVSAVGQNPTANTLGIPGSVEISASNVAWDAGADVMEASENVQIQYGPYQTTTDFISINANEKTVFIPRSFWVTSNRTSLESRNLMFNFGNYTGEADSINGHVAGIYISGDTIEVSPEIIRISNAKFTTCDQKPPHYAVQSGNLNIFPALGFIVSDNNLLLINDTPVFYFPTYIYGNKNYSLLGKNSPIPEIGSNTTEGWYIKENWGFVIDKQNSAVAHFGYVELNGFYVGVTHHYDLNHNNNFETRLDYLQRHGIGGGIAYHLETSDDSDKSDPLLVENILTTLFPNQKLPLSRLSILFSYHELVNNYWIDYFPLFRLEINEFKMPIFGLTPVLSSDANFGQIRERDSNLNNAYQSWRSNYNANLAQVFPLNDWSNATIGLQFIGFWYDTTQTWQRYFATYRIDANLGVVQPYVGYSDNLSNTGTSPFKFERENVIQNDEVLVGSKVFFGQFETEASVNYDLDLRKVRDSNLSVALLDHCNKVGVRWNMVSHSFSLLVDVIVL